MASEVLDYLSRHFDTLSNIRGAGDAAEETFCAGLTSLTGLGSAAMEPGRI